MYGGNDNADQTLTYALFTRSNIIVFTYQPCAGPAFPANGSESCLVSCTCSGLITFVMKGVLELLTSSAQRFCTLFDSMILS